MEAFFGSSFVKELGKYTHQEEKKETTGIDLFALPVELWYSILTEYLSPVDFYTCQYVCKDWHLNCNNAKDQLIKKTKMAQGNLDALMSKDVKFHITQKLVNKWQHGIDFFYIPQSCTVADESVVTCTTHYKFGLKHGKETISYPCYTKAIIWDNGKIVFVEVTNHQRIRNVPTSHN
jgi:hypothetical protein